jgi:hypothetical protein
MADIASSQDLAVATEAPTVVEAEMLCAALCAAGIKAFVPNAHSTNAMAHMTIGLNPAGVQVLVRTADLQAAKETLEDLRAERLAGDSDTPDNPCDTFARSAYLSAAFSIVMVPFVPLAFYYYIRARMACAEAPPVDANRFARHMRWTQVLIVAVMVLTVAWVAMIAF